MTLNSGTLVGGNEGGNKFHVLFVDSYDSFCFNIQRLIEQQFPGEVEVITIRNDTFSSLKQLHDVLPHFDALVIGPGPGNPKNGPQDVGILNDIFNDKDDQMARVPVLGICLGMQAMALGQGCDVEKLHTIKHGQVYEMNITQRGYDSRLFDNYPSSFKSTRYHSLHVLQSQNEKIIPLVTTHDENGELLMSIQVSKRPWYAVQYHPESCCSEYGAQLIQNFIKIAKNWNHNVTDRYLQRVQSQKEDLEMLKSLEKAIDRTPLFPKQDIKAPEQLTVDKPTILKSYTIPSIVNDPKFTLKLVDQIKQDKFIFASSSLSTNRGEWSIIALPDTLSEVFTHYDSLKRTTIHNWQDPNLNYSKLYDAVHGQGRKVSDSTLQILKEDKDTFWNTISNHMLSKMVSDEELVKLPFIGGLVGILGYEMGSYMNSVPADEIAKNKLIPDAKLVYIHNCILINHVDGIVYLISSTNDTSFPQEILVTLNNSDSWINEALDWESELPTESNTSFDIVMPSHEEYNKAFEMCQEYMHKGDSYEICLTTQTTVTPRGYTKPILPWTIFQTLVQRNPAPFTSYLEFNDLSDRYDSELCLISSSPERFLKWDNDICELRPIKGTVKKITEMTLEKATQILKTPKEFGENLMILDLIRNDLYELLQNVSVEEFMSVEEYKTVYQLVSVVRATGMDDSPYQGMDILKHSLPPGSMTGAPKKITVELLQEKIEPVVNSITCGGRRGVYSGVTGYWSLNGRGDWSVNIRCMYSYDSGSNWHLGAGGAITVLSTLEGEREEMFTKLESALQVFQ